jgi:hypothetical protein
MPNLIAWIGVALSVLLPVLSAAVLWGAMTERIRRVTDDVKQKIDREEFHAGMKRLDELHRDLREIREILVQVLAKGTP